MNSSPVSPEGFAIGQSRPCILVVEDEFLIRYMLSEELRESGYQVIEAANATEALAIIDGKAPDLIGSRRECRNCR
jgi:CheY-like chemotaxis protein